MEAGGGTGAARGVARGPFMIWRARRACAVTSGVGMSCSPRRSSRMYEMENCSLAASKGPCHT